MKYLLFRVWEVFPFYYTNNTTPATKYKRENHNHQRLKNLLMYDPLFHLISSSSNEYFFLCSLRLASTNQIKYSSHSSPIVFHNDFYNHHFHPALIKYFIGQGHGSLRSLYFTKADCKMTNTLF